MNCVVGLQKIGGDQDELRFIIDELKGIGYVIVG
jgi:hypothetical protein